MLKSTEKSLIKKMFLYPVLLIMFSFLLLMISSFITLKIVKKNEINKNIENLINSKKSYIKEHVVSLSQDVDNALKFSIDETKKSVKHRVYLIYYTVKSLYSLNKNKTFIITYLNQLNKYLKNHYIFAYDINGITKVHKLNSFLGRSIKTIYLSNHISFYEMSKKILQKSSEGFIEIKFFKPNHTNKKYLKIDFIKYIPELNLIIGSGEYVDEIKKKIENQIFQRVMIKKYGNNNYFFIIKKDGTLIINPTCKRKLGKIF